MWLPLEKWRGSVSRLQTSVSSFQKLSSFFDIV